MSSGAARGALARTIITTSAIPRVAWATRFSASPHQTGSAAPSPHAAVTAVAWASSGAEGPRWDGGETKTAKHQRFRRPTHHARVPEAFAHRPIALTVTTADGRDVVVGNPVSGHFKGFRGFETEKGIKHFKHRLRLRITGQHVYGDVDRPDGTIILSASTLEWATRRHLYSGSDKTACANIGTLMASRLKESGLTSIYFDREGRRYHGKVKAFIDAVVANGISLKEE